jgi:hypothetical protein
MRSESKQTLLQNRLLGNWLWRKAMAWNARCAAKKSLWYVPLESADNRTIWLNVKMVTYSARAAPGVRRNILSASRNM